MGKDLGRIINCYTFRKGTFGAYVIGSANRNT